MTRTTYIVRLFQNAQKSDSFGKTISALRVKSGFLTAFSKAFPKTEANVVRALGKDILKGMRRSHCAVGIGKEYFPIARTAMLVKRVKEGVWKRR